MRAYGFTTLGGPECEAFLDVPEPVAGEGELLVRVRAAGVNPGDWRLREGSYGPVAPAVLGREVAGRSRPSDRAFPASPSATRCSAAAPTCRAGSRPWPA